MTKTKQSVSADIKEERKINMNIILKNQECTGDYRFNGTVYMTSGFQNIFGAASLFIVLEALRLINDRIRTTGADYLQVLFCDDIKFWVIDDVTHVTFLLPEEY